MDGSKRRCYRSVRLLVKSDMIRLQASLALAGDALFAFWTKLATCTAVIIVFL